MSDKLFEAPDIELEDGAVPQKYAVEGPPPAPELQGWHHPRKQFVRGEQWAWAIEELLKDSPIDDGRPLAYIGLPGDDLLDIRYFVERICSKLNLPFLYLGLNQNIDVNSISRIRVTSAMFDIRTQFELVSESSDVVSDPLASVAVPDSIVATKLKAIGFFDIVNLDLCDGLAKNPPGAAQAENYEAIQHLLGEQFKSRRSWLMFLTTRIGDPHCDAETRKILKGLVESNMASCNEFENKVAELCGSAFDQASHELKTLVINLCGLLKWLGKMCVAESGWQMLTLAVDSYTIWGGAKSEDMFSIALRFVPISSPAKDPAGLGSAQPRGDDECRIALEVIERVHNRRNVDDLLKKDHELYQRVVAEKLCLLTKAGYDPDLYAKKVVEDWNLPLPVLAAK